MNKNREEWLQQAVEKLTPLFEAEKFEVPQIHVSIGWPSRGALSKKARSLGECWDASTSDDKLPHVFISPIIKEVTGPDGILATLVHEMIHCIVGTACRHKNPFKKLARAVGLEGKITETVAGEKLTERLNEISGVLGEWPLAGINIPETDEGDKKQTTRMVKCECETCGYTARTTQKWLKKIGPPLCPCNKEPMYAAPEKGEEPDEN